MNSEHFNVVVIDDKINVCQRISEKLSGGVVVLPNRTKVTVNVASIHVKVKRENIYDDPVLDSWTFSESILNDFKIASKHQVDLLIVDFIYIDSEVAKYFKEKAKKSDVDEKDITKKALNPHDLYCWFSSTDNLLKTDREKILNNIFHADAPVYLHSYTPQGLYAASGNIDQRKRKAALAFPKANLHVIDTRSELFNNDEFDWPSPSKYNGKYYPYQLAVLFDQIVQKEILVQEVEKRRFRNKIFIVHGHNEAAKEGVARFLEKAHIETLVLHEQPNLGKTIIEKFTHYSDVGFAIVLLTADDQGGTIDTPVEKQLPRARQNVILELGYFLGQLGRERVCALYEDGVDIPSDYNGVLFIPYDNKGAWRFLLAKELKEIGYTINLNKMI